MTGDNGVRVGRIEADLGASARHRQQSRTVAAMRGNGLKASRAATISAWDKPPPSRTCSRRLRRLDGQHPEVVVVDEGSAIRWHRLDQPLQKGVTPRGAPRKYRGHGAS